MSLTKIEIMNFYYCTNELYVEIDGEMKAIKLDHTTLNCIKDNIESCIKERTYVEL
jgi:hypothetical protein